jgi:hypothetical protein
MIRLLKILLVMYSKLFAGVKTVNRLQRSRKTTVTWFYLHQMSEVAFRRLVYNADCWTVRSWMFFSFCWLTNLVSEGVLRLSQQCCWSLCDVMPYQLVDSYHDFRWSECLVLQEQSVHIDDRTTLLYDCLTLTMKVLYM